MTAHKVVTREQWIDERKQLLAEEKALTRQRDELARKRRALPRVLVEKEYAFSTTRGTQTLAQTFGRHRQLIVQHFMLGEGWGEGCPMCSFWADGYDGLAIHIAQRDAAFVSVSNAPITEIEAYKKRMGWHFDWVSSFGTDFNRDYNVAFSERELAQDDAYYNYKTGSFPVSEAPGASVFFKDDAGRVYHTYSCYARGLDTLNAAYHYIDMLPLGRNEDELAFSMAWVKRHDEYDDV